MACIKNLLWFNFFGDIGAIIMLVILSYIYFVTLSCLPHRARHNTSSNRGRIRYATSRTARSANGDFCRASPGSGNFRSCVVPWLWLFPPRQTSRHSCEIPHAGIYPRLEFGFALLDHHFVAPIPKFGQRALESELAVGPAIAAIIFAAGPVGVGATTLWVVFHRHPAAFTHLTHK